MARTSTYLKNAILDAIFNATAFSLAGNPYISLHTGDPGTTGANEASGGSYARVQVAFNAAASGSAVNTASITYSSMPAATITHIGVWDASSGGNFLVGGALSESIAVLVGGSVVITGEHITAAVT